LEYAVHHRRAGAFGEYGKLFQRLFGGGIEVRMGRGRTAFEVQSDENRRFCG
jgi:hypothetical protein